MSCGGTQDISISINRQPDQFASPNAGLERDLGVSPEGTKWVTIRHSRGVLDKTEAQ